MHGAAIKICGRSFKKYSNVKVHEYPSGGSRVLQYGRADVLTLILAFRNFSYAPKMDFSLNVTD
jgi:hypothetical protein